MDDLKARLRREVPYQGKSRPAFLCDEAADRIEQLEARITVLEEALGLFDDTIKHQYSGSREAMSDLTYAAQKAARVLKRGAWKDLSDD